MSITDPLPPPIPSILPGEPAGPTSKATSLELDDAKKAGKQLLTELKNFGVAASKLAVKTVKDVKSRRQA